MFKLPHALILFSSLGHAAWVLDWSDEFGSDSASKTTPSDLWCAWDGPSNGSASYISTGEPPRNSQVWLEKGQMHIQANKDSSGAIVSGMVSTGGGKVNGKPCWGYKAFGMGYLELRAKLPSGHQTWPAIWTQGGWNWPSTGEIDILESLGTKDDSTITFYNTIHYGASDQERTEKQSRYSVPYDTLFHDFGLFRQKDLLEFSLDQKIRTRMDLKQIDGPYQDYLPNFNRDQYLLLNLQVGGWAGGEGNWKNNYQYPQELPQTFSIDYVRYYREIGLDSMGKDTLPINQILAGNTASKRFASEQPAWMGQGQNPLGGFEIEVKDSLKISTQAEYPLNFLSNGLKLWLQSAGTKAKVQLSLSQDNNKWDLGSIALCSDTNHCTGQSYALAFAKVPPGHYRLEMNFHVQKRTLIQAAGLEFLPYKFWRSWF